MGIGSDLKILWHMAVSPSKGKTHAERMDNFYRGQAGDYDDFRKRLLKGRQELWDKLDPPDGGIWVDMGGGTGSNLEYFGDKIDRLQKVYVVDLASSLLEVAKKRAADKGWTKVETIEADATVWQPPEGSADVVTFSYSITMIPDWFGALENALRMLKPGGILGIVDFYVPRKFPSEGHRKQGGMGRAFWPIWFSRDNVFLSPDHVPWLHSHLDVEYFEEFKAKIPYMPLVRAPYYIFVGRKRAAG